MSNYPYLKDKSFLLLIDNLQTKEIFVKIIALTWEEKEIGAIEGFVTSGTLNINGDSSVRRTCSLSLAVAENNLQDLKISHVKDLVTIDKKVRIEIGITNSTDQYPQYDKIWFPMGTFIITEASYTHTLQGISISLNLKDKMCMLNGFCGGVLPATTTFHVAEIPQETGDIIREPITIFQMIQEIVHHYGGEDLNNIIIKDISQVTRQRVSAWRGEAEKLYIVFYIKNGEKTLDWWKTFNKEQFNSFFKDWTLDKEEVFSETFWDEKTHKFEDEDGSLYIFKNEDKLGYTYEKTTWGDGKELIGQAGNNLCTILDQIKNRGNYEYFYNLDGQFVFQEKKNFLNVSPEEFAEDFYDSSGFIDMNRYLLQYDSGHSEYSFDNGNIITSYSNSPKYDKIKNDYTIWGDKSKLRYHLAIDTKPEYGHIEYSFAICLEEDKFGNQTKVIKFLTPTFTEVGDFGYVYEKEDNSYWLWMTEKNSFITNLVETRKSKYMHQLEDFENVLTYAEERKDLISKYSSKGKITIENLLQLLRKTEGRLHPKTQTSEETEELPTEVLSLTNIKNRIQDAYTKYPLLEYSMQEENGIPYLVSNYFPDIKIFIQEVDVLIKDLKKMVSLVEEAHKILEKVVMDPSSTTETAKDAADKLVLAETYCDRIETNSPIVYKRISGIDPTTNKPITDVTYKDISLLLWSIEMESTLLKKFLFGYVQIDLEETNIEIVKNEVTKDWREELYLQGLEKEYLNLPVDYYYKELKAEWLKIYDMKHHCFYEDFLKNPWNYSFFLDFLDTDAPISALKIENIGRRQVVSVEENIKNLFAPAPAHIAYIEEGDPQAQEKINQAEEEGYDYILFPMELFSMLKPDTSDYSAFEYIQSMLHDWTSYHESITIQCLPIYYLEPNTRIKVQDFETNIYGEYVISSMSIPLDPKGTMSISAVRAPTRL